MSKTKDTPEIVTAETLGGRISMTKEQIWRLHRQKKIPVISIGRRSHRYDVAAVLAALAKLTQPAKEVA